MKAPIKFWIIGILLAAIGVILARVVAPSFSDQALIQVILFFLGILIAVGGLGVILTGFRRK